MIVLETDRLLIRDHVPEDLGPLYSLLSDGRVMHFIEDLKVDGPQGAEANLRVALEEAARKDRWKYFFAILDKASGDYVGEIGFTRLEAQAAAVEMGYFILERFWNRGLVTEAGRRVVRFAFEECGVERILIGCYKANRGSEKVMVKLGFRKEREFEGAVHHEGESATRVEYSMGREMPGNAQITASL